MAKSTYQNKDFEGQIITIAFLLNFELSFWQCASYKQDKKADQLLIMDNLA